MEAPPATAGPASPSAGPLEIRTRATKYGRILVDGRGMTIYVADRDKADFESTCHGPCTRDWPPLFTNGQVTAGPRVNSAWLGTIGRTDGPAQVEYNGWPLYYSARDTEPGTVNGQGSLRVEVTGTGEQTALAGIMRLVAEAQSSRSRAQALADRAAFLLTIVAIAAAVVTALVWPLLDRPLEFTMERVVTVLVIACPHALGLAIPLVVAISTTLGARQGLLVRDRRGLEEARNLDVVVFDKTGTLTLGSHRVVGIVAAADVAEDEALRLAAGAQRDAEHPIAQAILASQQSEIELMEDMLAERS